MRSAQLCPLSSAQLRITHYAVCSPAMRVRPPLVFALVVPGVVGLLSATQTWVLTPARERRLPFGVVAGYNLASWYLWAALSPLIVALGRRFPLDATRWRRSLAVHLLVGSLVAVSHATATSMFVWLAVRRYENEPFGAMLLRSALCRFPIELPAALRGALVPDLILQPLVENAVKHAVSTHTAPVHVAVRARRLGDRLELRVEDDGPGLVAAPPPEGIGLATTRERLTRLYDGAGRLTLEPGPGGQGLSAVVALPRARERVSARRDARDTRDAQRDAALDARVGARLDALLAQLRGDGRVRGAPRAWLARIAIRETDRVMYVPVDEVDWLEADDNYVRVHARGNARLLRETLK